MYLIVGLGNPGTEYAATRHNIGFDMLTYLCDKYDISMNSKEKKAITGRGFIGSEKVMLAKPQTYMNDSGKSIRALRDYYKLSDDDIIVYCDDINLPVGKIRVRPGGSAGGHNGLKSIIAELGTEKFIRIRIGVGAPAKDLIGHVLGRFEKDEEAHIRDVFALGDEALIAMLSGGVDKAMNMVNGKDVVGGA